MYINKIIKVGLINSLKIVRETDNGLYLEDEEHNEVLLPNAYVEADMEFDSVIDVFVYRDSEDRLVAITDFPKVYKDQFGFVKVVDIVPFGAFVDIGLPKDLLVPKNRQKTPFRVGEKRFVRVIEDEETNRLIGVEKITSYLSRDTSSLNKNDEVEILIFAKTDLGYKVIVNNNFEGLIYHNEIFEKLNVGDKKTAYIKNIRTEDNKLDISLQPIGSGKYDKFTSKILGLLNTSGALPYNYKSDANDIQKIFGMSKKNFKKSLTILQNDGKITINDEGIKLNS